MIQLGFELKKTVDELECADEYWINRMLLDLDARAIASAPTDAEYHRRTMRLLITQLDGD